MVSYKLDKYDRIFVAFVCVLVVLFNIGTLVFATEENALEPIIEEKNDIVMSINGYLATSTGFVTYFLTLEDGYYYDIDIINNSSTENPAIRVGFTDSKENGAEVYNFSRVENNYHVTINANDYNYFYFDFGGMGKGDDMTYTIKKYEVQSMDGTIQGLVDNVGINNFWGVFEGGIDFVGVVVLVAFGVFLLALAIKKISKGKSEF